MPRTFLFVTWAGGGNVNPVLALAARLGARGHGVHVLGPRELGARVEAAGALFEARDHRDEWDPATVARDVEAATERTSPDTVVVDYMLPSALCAAERTGRPTAALVHTLYRSLRHDGDLPTMSMAAGVDTIRSLRHLMGLDDIARLAELLDRATAVLVTAPAELDGPPPADGEVPANVRYVGPVLEDAGPDAGWNPPVGGDSPLVAVTMGTTPQDEVPVLERTLAALGSMPVRVHATIGDHVGATTIACPANTTIGPYVRHAAVLPHAALTVCHAGLGTVLASLAHGVPLVCLPIGREQPQNAAAVERVGAGRALPAPASAETVAAVMQDVLDAPGYRAAAGRVAATIGGPGAGDRAVDELERVATGALVTARTLPVMRVGVQMIFQSWGYGGTVSDGEVVDQEVRLGVLADDLGFHALWPVEHHFTDYSFCPDNTVFLANMAARTQRILLGTGAVILPWNDPLRVAEKIALLDHLTGGRVLFGMGRGLARREYAGFGIPMDESRDRFDESAPMILDALETGVIEGSGPYFPQPRTAIRPKPARSFRDRTYCVAMSPDSVLAAADLGARMVMFSQRPWVDQAASVRTYRERFLAVQGSEPHPPVVCDFVYCDRDPGRAEALAHAHIAAYLTSVMEHYELESDHFKQAAGYESYGSAVDMLRAIGLEKLCEMYLGVNVWGTPDQIVQRLEARRDVVGDHDLTCCFRFAGLPYDDAEASMRLFATDVLPVVQAPLVRHTG